MGWSDWCGKSGLRTARRRKGCGVPEAVFALLPTDNVGEAHVQSRIPPGSRARRAGKECGKAGPPRGPRGPPPGTSPRSRGVGASSPPSPPRPAPPPGPSAARTLGQRGERGCGAARLLSPAPPETFPVAVAASGAGRAAGGREVRAGAGGRCRAATRSRPASPLQLGRRAAAPRCHRRAPGARASRLAMPAAAPTPRPPPPPARPAPPPPGKCPAPGPQRVWDKETRLQEGWGRRAGPAGVPQALCARVCVSARTPTPAGTRFLGAGRGVGVRDITPSAADFLSVASQRGLPGKRVGIVQGAVELWKSACTRQAADIY